MTVEERRNNQSEEDYLESILILSDRLPVNKAVKLLCARGYVYEDGKHLYLTENGRAYASSVYEKHCIIRDYLIDRGVSPAAAESDACKMEHLVSEETFLMMKNAVAARRG